jgi:hypothetical protein
MFKFRFRFKETLARGLGGVPWADLAGVLGEEGIEGLEDEIGDVDVADQGVAFGAVALGVVAETGDFAH